MYHAFCLLCVLKDKTFSCASTPPEIILPFLTNGVQEVIFIKRARGIANIHKLIVCFTMILLTGISCSKCLTTRAPCKRVGLKRMPSTIGLHIVLASTSFNWQTPLDALKALLLVHHRPLNLNQGYDSTAIHWAITTFMFLTVHTGIHGSRGEISLGKSIKRDRWAFIDESEFENI